MEEERNTEGWSARQLIKQLKGSAGNRQQAAGSSQFEAPYSVGSRHFDAPTKEENQSRTRSVGTAGRQFDAATKEENQSRTRSAGTEVGQPGPGEASANHTTGPAGGQRPTGKKSQGGIFRGLISGTLISESLILKDMKYSALIAVLAIIFIANKFNAERVEREIIVLEQEVRDMRAEALSVSAELGSVSRQSEITDLVKERGLGLEELREPPYRIVVNK